MVIAALLGLAAVLNAAPQHKLCEIDNFIEADLMTAFTKVIKRALHLTICFHRIQIYLAILLVLLVFKNVFIFLYHEE